MNDVGLSEEAQKWAYEKYQAKDKMVVNIFGAFKQNQDKDDFIDSIARLYKKQNKVTLEVKVDPPSKDPFILEIEALASFGKFEPVCVQWCKDMILK